MTSMYLRMLGKILSSYFSAKISLVQVMEVLSAVLASPDRAPLQAYSSLRMSYCSLALASSSRRLLSSSRAFSYYYRIRCYSASYSGVFWGTGSGAGSAVDSAGTYYGQPDMVSYIYRNGQVFNNNLNIDLTVMKGAKPKTPTLSASKPSLNPRDRLSEHDVQQLKSTFDLFDEDHGGTIDPAEIQKILQELGLDRRNNVVFLMISDLQAKNRPINFEQFLQIICGRLGDTKSRDGLKKLFALYDTDGQGFINFQKMKTVARELGETMNDEEITEMMHNTHILNGTESNEYFTFDEFYQIVTKKKY